MIEVHPTLYSFLLELLAVLVVIVGWFLFDSIKRRNRDRKVVAIVIAKLKQGAQARKDAVKTYLEKVYQLEGDELEGSVDKLARQENGFYQVFINHYIKRDSRLAGSIIGLTESLLLPYRQPEQLIGEPQVTQVIATEEAHSSDPEDKSLIEQLKQQNQRLIKENNKLHLEVSTTGQTLEQMLAEYSRAFDKSQQQNSDQAPTDNSQESTQVAQHSTDEQVPVDQEALATNLEADSSGGSDDEAIDEEALAAAWAAQAENENGQAEEAPIDEEALAAAWSTEVTLDEEDEKQSAVH